MIFGHACQLHRNSVIIVSSRMRSEVFAITQQDANLRLGLKTDVCSGKRPGCKRTVRCNKTKFFYRIATRDFMKSMICASGLHFWPTNCPQGSSRAINFGKNFRPWHKLSTSQKHSCYIADNFWRLVIGHGYIMFGDHADCGADHSS